MFSMICVLFYDALFISTRINSLYQVFRFHLPGSEIGAPSSDVAPLSFAFEALSSDFGPLSSGFEPLSSDFEALRSVSDPFSSNFGALSSGAGAQSVGFGACTSNADALCLSIVIVPLVLLRPLPCPETALTDHHGLFRLWPHCSSSLSSRCYKTSAPLNTRHCRTVSWCPIALPLSG